MILAGADVTAADRLWEWRSLDRRWEAAPFFGAILFVRDVYLGIAISLFPLVAVEVLDFGRGFPALDPGVFAGGDGGAGARHPLYSGFSYWVFRGKVRGDLGYH